MNGLLDFEDFLAWMAARGYKITPRKRLGYKKICEAYNLGYRAAADDIDVNLELTKAGARGKVEPPE